MHSCKGHEALWNIPEDTQKLQSMELGHMLAAHLMEEAGKELRTKLVALDTPSLSNLIGFLSHLKHMKITNSLQKNEFYLESLTAID